MIIKIRMFIIAIDFQIKLSIFSGIFFLLLKYFNVYETSEPWFLLFAFF